MENFYKLDPEKPVKIRFLPMPKTESRFFFSVDHMIEPMDTDVLNPMEIIDAERKIAFKKYLDDIKQQNCIFDEYINKAKAAGINFPIKKVTFSWVPRLQTNIGVSS